MKHYVHVAAGSESKPGTLAGRYAVRADYVKLPDGSAIGCLTDSRKEVRQKLEEMAGVTVIGAAHDPRPIGPSKASLIAHAGVVATDTVYDAGEKLHAFHAMPWFHPEYSEL